MVNSINSIFYVYGNKKNQDGIENEIQKITDTYFSIPISKQTLVGFKVVSFDKNDIMILDKKLSSFESWVQTDRRNDYEEIETNYINFDKFITGCNYRVNITTNEELIYYCHMNNGVTGFRKITLINDAGTYGTYDIFLGGNDKIHGLIGANTILENDKIFIKNLKNITVSTDYTNCVLDEIQLETENEIKKGFDILWVSSSENINDTSLTTYTEKNMSTFNIIWIPHDYMEEIGIVFAHNSVTDIIIEVSYQISGDSATPFYLVGIYGGATDFSAKHIAYLIPPEKKISGIDFRFTPSTADMRYYDISYRKKIK